MVLETCLHTSVSLWVECHVDFTLYRNRWSGVEPTSRSRQHGPGRLPTTFHKPGFLGDRRLSQRRRRFAFSVRRQPAYHDLSWFLCHGRLQVLDTNRYRHAVKQWMKQTSKYKAEYLQGCGSQDLVLVSRPIKTTFLRSWSWTWSRPVWSWSGLGLGLPGLDNISGYFSYGFSVSVSVTVVIFQLQLLFFSFYFYLSYFA